MKKGVMVATSVAVVASLPFYGYTWNLMMHIFGSVLFMGNIAVSAVWFSLAKRTRVADTIRFAARGVAVTDMIFTVPGSILVLLNGGIIGKTWFKSGSVWIMLATALFILVGILWLAVLVPVQKRMLQAAAADPLSGEMDGLMSRWFRFGGVATLLSLAMLVLMVWKPAW